ncbi:hypothetical protein [Clostridium saccharoperbutylacetonicum]|uniref:hypothetical protein n=1 Tax=Clostridium saccharoperbutylacetonicum TaxID=36745 RepID=UPI0039E7E715
MDNLEKKTAQEVPVQNDKLLKTIDELNRRIRNLLKEAQPKIEDFLINDNLTIVLNELDSDFVGISIIGTDLNLKGKALKVPSENNKQVLLSISYLERN